MIKTFIDGKDGTTGLQLYDRLKKRADITLWVLSEELRKDAVARAEMLNACDFAFLCLPDAAAVQAVNLIKNPYVRVIDASTAHRTAAGWTYGFPELSKVLFSAVRESARVAVPGCHASGFTAIVYPLVKCGIASADYPFYATSISGYSGGGKKMIAEYETAFAKEKDNGEVSGDNCDIDYSAYESPRQYALLQNHKHIKEMQSISSLAYAPVFQPIVSPYYCGMEVSVPLFARMLNKKQTVDGLFKFYTDYYSGQALISVEKAEEGFLAANLMRDCDGMKIYVGGNDERIVISALYDNLGKGASGAAVECFNIMTGISPTYGLKRLFI